MGETSYPYAGGGGVTDARYEELMARVTGTGRIAYNPSSTTLSQGLVYADSTGRQVKVRGNQAAIVRGFRWQTDAAGLLQPIEANTSGQTRIDLAVLRLIRETFRVSLRIVKGAPATTPVAPSPTQRIAADGVWEWPVAAIRVTSSSTSGLPSIGPADVTALDHFVAPPAMTGHSARRPPAEWGALWTQYDTGRTYVGHGGSWHLIGENDAYTRITASGNWITPGNLYASRRNGFTYFQGVVQLAIGDRAAGTDLTICTLPADYRSKTDLFGLGYLDGGNLARVHLDASANRLYLANYDVTIKKGSFLTIHPITWLSA